MNDIQQKIVQQFPEYSATNGWKLSTTANELTELTSSFSGVVSDVRDYLDENSEDFFSEAIYNSVNYGLKENTRRLICPEGYLYVEIYKENQNMLLMIKL